MNNITDNFDIAIVGGGIVGAVVACLLGRHAAAGTIAVIEEKTSIPEFIDGQFDPRVVALSPASVTILEEIGVWGEIADSQRACPYYQMQVWDAEGTGAIQFDCDDVHQPCLGYIVENSVLIRALYTVVRALDNIALISPATVESIGFAQKSGDKHRLSIGGGDDIHSNLIIAADGPHSRLRDLAGMAVREWDYHQHAIITTVETQNSHQFTAWQQFTATGPIAFLPLTNAGESSHYCSLVWSADNDCADQLMQLTSDEFCQRLSRQFEYKLGEICHTDQRYKIKLVQRHAKRYVKTGFALVGDAAHTIHPLAGQGVNLGLYDAKALAEEIALALERKIPVDELAVLMRYERRRQSHNLMTMAAMEGLKRLFGADDPVLRWIRNSGLRYLNQQRWVKQKLIAVANG